MTNWDEVPEMGSRVKVPGMYHIRVQDCEDAGDYWQLTLRVLEGPLKGADFVDFMRFKGDWALRRSKMIFGKFGVKPGEDAKALVGREAWVEYSYQTNKKTGVTRMQVAFDGYRTLEQGACDVAPDAMVAPRPDSDSGPPPSDSPIPEDDVPF